jgi:hypothetical protein
MMMVSIRETLAREAIEAEMVADEEERGERAPQPGQRPLRGFMPETGIETGES